MSILAQFPGVSRVKHLIVVSTKKWYNAQSETKKNG